MTKLILFDIDGTLVQTGGAGARAMMSAFEEVFGPATGIRSISMAGRTDAWIVAQMLAERGLSVHSDGLQLFQDTYITRLMREVHEPGPQKGILPGVNALLDSLMTRDDVYLALLTGNYQRGARIKLEYFDLWRYFPTGAFGDDAHDRNGLLWKALANVEAAGGPQVRPSEVVIIGDTPLDVAVAVAGGARSLAVGTGSYDVDTLRESGADEALLDLTDHGRVMAALGLLGG